MSVDNKVLTLLNKTLLILVDYVLPLVLLFLIPYSLYHSFVLAPAEKVMGPAQRILYFHVGSALGSYAMLGVLFISCVCFLAFEKIEFILLSISSASVAFIYSSIVLMTGMLWGYSSWNTWWNWEPRLVSMLILWIFLITFLYLQNVRFSSENVKHVVLSITGILCAIQVPIVIFSIKLLDRTQQLHPEVVAKQGLTDPGYSYALLFSSAALILLSIWICRLHYRVNILNYDFSRLKRSYIKKYSR